MAEFALPNNSKIVKKYLDGATLVKEAVATYKEEVQSRQFPDERHVY